MKKTATKAPKSSPLKIKTNVRAGMNKGDLVNQISMPTLNRRFG